jgi:hypothetical protein
VNAPHRPPAQVSSAAGGSIGRSGNPGFYGSLWGVPLRNQGNSGHLDNRMGNRTGSIAAAVAMVIACLLLVYALIYG